jgi:hypothetical protein
MLGGPAPQHSHSTLAKQNAVAGIPRFFGDNVGIYAALLNAWGYHPQGIYGLYRR